VNDAVRAAVAAHPPLGARIKASLSFAVRWVRDNYCNVDPRTAGLFRIVLGALMAADALRHWSEASWAYSNDGVLTNHFHLFRPDSGWNFSIFHAFSSMNEVSVAFTIAILCHLCLMVGWHSRLFALLSCVIVTSLDNRMVMVENGGYVVVNLIAFYAAFLPIERRFSIDAWLRSYRETKEQTVADLNAHAHPAWETAPLVSIVGLLVILNLGIVYFFNVVNKSGHIWRAGDTVHYVLWLNRMVTGVAVFFREVLPYQVTRVLTWSVLCTEALLTSFILSPNGKRYTRPIAMVLMLGLHTTFGVMMRLGPFSWYLIGWSILLLTPFQWADAETFYRRRASPRTVVLDRTAPLAFHLGRIFARLDKLDLLTFEASDEADAAPALIKVVDPASGRASTGIAAAREIAQALPAGRFLFPIARVASLGTLDFLVRWAPQHRVWIARIFGLENHATGRERAKATPIGDKARRAGQWMLEAALYWFMFCSVLQAFTDNKSVPPWMKPKGVPDVVHATVGYPRLFQGWGMFAPNPITEDGTVVVDAITSTGRHVDPFTNLPPELDLTKSDGLGLSQIRQDYFNRIRLDHNKAFRQGMKEWLLAYPKRTGREEDEIVAFDAFWVRAQCPAPYQDRPYKNERVAIATFRKPGYRAPPGQPPIPPEPPIESAERPALGLATSSPASPSAK
jgi:hypothetical protein